MEQKGSSVEKLLARENKIKKIYSLCNKEGHILMRNSPNKNKKMKEYVEDLGCADLTFNGYETVEVMLVTAEKAKN